MKKKLLVMSIMILSLFVVLTGCGEKANSTGDAKAKDKENIVIGLDDTFVPMGFRDESGEIVGFDVDLAKEVFNRLGVEIKFQPIDWSMKETELNSGNIDLIWNGYTITEERKEKVAFTEPYIKNRQVIVTMSDSSINNKKDLEGKKVAAQSGSSSVDAINKEPEVVASFDGAEPVLFDTNNEAFIDLEAGRSDALVVDEILARYYIVARGSEKYKVLEEDFGNEEYGIGVRKDDTELVEDINTTIQAMIDDGKFAEISEKWFGENLSR